MNKEEIKEILDKLKDENNYQLDCNDGSSFKELFVSEISSLLDYITNLHDRIDKALDFINAWKDNKTDLKVSMLDLLQIEGILRGEDNE